MATITAVKKFYSTGPWNEECVLQKKKIAKENLN